MSPEIGRCELTHLRREAIDAEVAAAQHRSYEEALVENGCRLRRLPPAPELPDGVFVEDTAVVLDEIAVVARPGAPSRRPEVGAVAEALESYRPLARIRSPGRLDGGDVLAVGRTLFAGRSTRTDAAGIEQLAAAVEPFGYRVVPVDFRGCLHLKSAATRVGPETVLANTARVRPELFAGLELIEVASDEPEAGNALWIDGVVIHPAGFRRTRSRLEARGLTVRPVELTELAKAEGGVTCCSLVFEPGPAG